MIEVTEFAKALLLSVGFTQKIPFRYGRFEKRVLGPNASEEQKADLKKHFTAFIDSAKFELDNAGPGKRDLRGSHVSRHPSKSGTIGIWRHNF